MVRLNAGRAPVRRLLETLKCIKLERLARDGGKLPLKLLSDRSRVISCCSWAMFLGMGPVNELEWRSRVPIWLMRPISGGEGAIEPVLGGGEMEELGAVEEGGGEGTCEGVVVEGEGEESGESS